MRYTSENIHSLGTKEVFVFGSNLAGIHGAGAAKKALEFGAVMGKGVGFKGRTYAIPTKNENIRTMPVEAIEPYVKQFIDYASKNQHLTFLVTQIGCGLAGYSPEDIAPLFENALLYDNIVLPEEFYNILTNKN